ncbi:MAG: peptidase U32 family protein [Collinsella sp.]
MHLPFQACSYSALMRGRSANRGDCTQPCRLAYELQDGSGAVLAGGAWERGRAAEEQAMRPDGDRLLCPRDYLGIRHIAEMLEAGVSALFKIGGRMKSPDYVYNVVRCYREALDAALAGRPLGDVELDGLEACLARSFSRGFTSGYLQWRARRHRQRPLLSVERAINQGLRGRPCVVEPRYEGRWWRSIARWLRVTCSRFARPRPVMRRPMSPSAGRSFRARDDGFGRGSPAHSLQAKSRGGQRRARGLALASARFWRPRPRCGRCAKESPPGRRRIAGRGAQGVSLEARRKPIAGREAGLLPASWASIALSAEPARFAHAHRRRRDNGAAWRTRRGRLRAKRSSRILGQPSAGGACKSPHTAVDLGEVCRLSEDLEGARAACGACRSRGEAPPSRSCSIGQIPTGSWCCRCTLGGGVAAAVSVNAETARVLVRSVRVAFGSPEELTMEDPRVGWGSDGGTPRRAIPATEQALASRGELGVGSDGSVPGRREASSAAESAESPHAVERHPGDIVDIAADGSTPLMITEHCLLTAEGPCSNNCPTCPRRLASQAGDRFLVELDRKARERALPCAWTRGRTRLYRM